MEQDSARFNSLLSGFSQHGPKGVVSVESFAVWWRQSSFFPAAMGGFSKGGGGQRVGSIERGEDLDSGRIKGREHWGWERTNGGEH